MPMFIVGFVFFACIGYSYFGASEHADTLGSYIPYYNSAIRPQLDRLVGIKEDQEAVIGKIIDIQGDAAMRPNSEFVAIPARKHLALRSKTLLTTSADSKMSLLLGETTLIELTENSTLLLDVDSEHRGSLSMVMLEGEATAKEIESSKGGQLQKRKVLKKIKIPKLKVIRVRQENNKKATEVAIVSNPKPTVEAKVEAPEDEETSLEALFQETPKLAQAQTTEEKSSVQNESVEEEAKIAPAQEAEKPKQALASTELDEPIVMTPSVSRGPASVTDMQAAESSEVIDLSSFENLEKSEPNKLENTALETPPKAISEPVVKPQFIKVKPSYIQGPRTVSSEQLLSRYVREKRCKEGKVLIGYLGKLAKEDEEAGSWEKKWRQSLGKAGCKF